MNMHFVEGETVRNLEPEAGQGDADFFTLPPQTPVSLGRDLDDALADEFGELAELLVQRVMVLQVVFAGVGLLRAALLAVPVTTASRSCSVSAVVGPGRGASVSARSRRLMPPWAFTGAGRGTSSAAVSRAASSSSSPAMTRRPGGSCARRGFR